MKCPKCKHSLVVPNPKSNNSPVTPQTDTSGTGGSAAVPAPSDLIGFNCDCGQKLKVPAGAVGKKVKCPKCSLVLVVRDPSAVVEEAEPDSLLYELADQEEEAELEAPAAKPTADWQTPCPQCKAMKVHSADVCPYCGFDIKKGKVRKTVKSKKTTKAGREKSEVAATALRAVADKFIAASFLRGCLLSAIGALLGGVIWFVVAVVSDYEFGMIAWLVGGLAGWGMNFGNGGGVSTFTGIVAAVMAFIGIVAAKVMIFIFFAYAMISGNTNDINLLRVGLIFTTANEMLDERGIHSESERVAQWESTFDEAAKKVSAMSDDQVRAQSQQNQAAKEQTLANPPDFRAPRLASHNARRRAKELGLSYGSKARDGIYQKELEKYQGMSDAELDEAIADLDDWEAGGKWEDADYLRSFLIYQQIDEAIAERGLDEGGKAITRAQWREMYDEAAADVDEISADEQFVRAKTIDAQKQQEIQEDFAQMGDQGSFDQADLGFGPGDVFDLVVTSFVGTFHMYSLLFIVLALLTAFWVASDGFGSGA
ncbi:MAG: RING finger protein [Planctomycetota bacterium]